MSAPRFGWCFVAETPCAMRARKLRFVPSQNEKFCVNQQFCKWLDWKRLHTIDLPPCERRPIGQTAFLNRCFQEIDYVVKAWPTIASARRVRARDLESGD